MKRKKTSANDWFGYSTQLCCNGKLTDVHNMTSEVPVEFHSKIFASKETVDELTCELFLQALANLVTKFTKLATAGNVTELPAGHSALQVAAKQAPTLLASTGQEVVAADIDGSGVSAAKPTPSAISTVPDISNLRLVDEPGDALVGPVVRPSTIDTNTVK